MTKHLKVAEDDVPEILIDTAKDMLSDLVEKIFDGEGVDVKILNGASVAVMGVIIGRIKGMMNDGTISRHHCRYLHIMLIADVLSSMINMLNDLDFPKVQVRMENLLRTMHDMKDDIDDDIEEEQEAEDFTAEESSIR